MSPSNELRDRNPLRRLSPAAVLAGLAVLAYANSFGGAFVFDDLESIVFNAAVHGVRAFLDGGYRARPNRAVGYLTFALNHDLGGLDPTGYHVVNFCIHVVNALLVYALVVLTFRTPRLRASALSSSSRAVALVAAALFVAHPLQTQAVTYVVQRLTSLAATFYLATIVLYVRWRLAGDSTRLRRALGYLPVLASALLAMRTKEIAFTLPFAVALWELCFFQGRLAPRVARLTPILATLAVIPLTLVNLGGSAGATLSDVGAATRVQTELTRLAYFRIELAVVATYLRLLVLPVGQNVDPDYPRPASFLDPRVVWATLLVAALFGLAVLLLRASSAPDGKRRVDPALGLVGGGILWFFLALAVESSFIPIVDVMLEHRVYLPSVGAFMAVATAGSLAARRLRTADPPRATVIAGLALATALALVTLARNRVWADQLSLWSDAAAKSPMKSRPYNGVASALIDLGRLEEAEPYAAAAVRLDPGSAEGRYNLGRIYLEEGRYEAALPLFREAIRIQPDYPDAYANMAGALNRLGRAAEAARMLEAVGPLVRDSPPAQFNLGVAYAVLGEHDSARRQVAILRTLAPPLAAQLDEFLARR